MFWLIDMYQLGKFSDQYCYIRKFQKKLKQDNVSKTYVQPKKSIISYYYTKIPISSYAHIITKIDQPFKRINILYNII